MYFLLPKSWEKCFFILSIFPNPNIFGEIQKFQRMTFKFLEQANTFYLKILKM
jgi:hypothetical protein